MGRVCGALAVVAMVLAVGAAPAAAVTKTPVERTVKVGPNDDVSCKVVGDLYVPDGVSPQAPAAAVLATNGFGGSKDDLATLGTSYAQRGFVFLAYSGLGFGGSGCKITLDDPDWDGKAASQLVTFLADTKLVTLDAPGDPRVGMIGGSYGGQIQFAVASIDRRVDALVPQITWNDLAYSLTPNNTDLPPGTVSSTTPGVAKLDWPLLFSGLGIGQGLQQAFANGDPSHLGACPNFADQVCPALIGSAAFGAPRAQDIAFLRHASVASYVDKIRVPTLLSQGQSDTLFNLQEAIATYRALKAQGTPVKMVWRSAGHSGGSLGASESDSTNLEAAYESRMAYEWLDFWLNGAGDAPAQDVSFFRDWAFGGSGDAAPAVGSAPSYPVGADRAFHLSAGAELTTDPGQVESGSASFGALTVGLTGSGNGAVEIPTPDLPGTTTAFTSAPLDGDLDVAGVPKVRVRLDAPTFAGTQGIDPTFKLVVFAKLLDVAPDGTATLPRNQISAVRVGDVTKPVEIELPGIVHRFARGHRLRLQLSSSNTLNRGNSLPGIVTVRLDAGDPSVLSVPVLPAPGPTGSGPDGTTPYAPRADSGDQPGTNGTPAGAPAPPSTPSVSGKAASSGTAGLPAPRRACRSRRAFTITLRKAPRGDRIRSAEVRVNGKRVKVLRARAGKRLSSKVVLRGLPKGTFRVTVTVRTAKGRTLRSARTYRTCVPTSKSGKKTR
ncbi:MAG TPA: alpha/beta fold hydrolase [Solirubrobacteraceae bacterium]|nr:alpha/beta fold hydrolase [Solirubrobacteraceae bacterium]